MLDQTDGYTTADGRKIGGVVMEMKNITLRFGGVTAIEDISFDIRKKSWRRIKSFSSLSFYSWIFSRKVVLMSIKLTLN